MPEDLVQSSSAHQHMQSLVFIPQQHSQTNTLPDKQKSLEASVTPGRKEERGLGGEGGQKRERRKGKRCLL